MSVPVLYASTMKGAKNTAMPANPSSIKRRAVGKSAKTREGHRGVPRESYNSHADVHADSSSDVADDSPTPAPTHNKKRKVTTALQSLRQEAYDPSPSDSSESDTDNKQRGPIIATQGAETVVYKCNGIFDTSQSFRDFGALHLDRRLTKVLVDVLNMQHPTHVQAQVVPLALGGRDLVVEGRAGSGKTLAYVLPLLQRLLRLHAQQQVADNATLPVFSGIVLVPTKELCIQVYDVLTPMLKYTNDIVTVSHTGNAQKLPEGLQIVPPTVMVATPTGLLQYLDRLRRQQHNMDWQLSLQMLVVDEADLLFAFGFEKDTRRLLQQLPSTASRHYQTILVSATQNHELAQLQSLMLHKPLIVRIEEKEGSHGGPGAAGPIGEFYFQVPSDAEKWLVAYAFLRLGLVPLKCLVFCKDVANVYALRLFLDRFGIASGVLSPTLPVAGREQQIQAFNQGLIDILITNDGQGELAGGESDVPQENSSATPADSAASGQHQATHGKDRLPAAFKTKDLEFAGHRGLDLQNVACVFNFDAPASVKSYIHRIGRTGRGGAGGVAVTLIDSSQQQQTLLQQLITLRRTPGTNDGSTLTPLSLQLQDVECFRYRVEDVRRGLTKRVVAAAVARDLQQQLLNSRKLKEFFERNPRDREVLKRACKQLKELNVSKGHLGHLPDYLLSQTQPTQMTAVQLAIQQQKAAEGRSKGSQGSSRRRPVADPLKSFQAAVARVASAGKHKKAKRPPVTRAGQLAKMPRHADEVPPEALPATSGRKLWKLRHNKRVGVKGPKGNFLRKRSIKGLRKK